MRVWAKMSGTLEFSFESSYFLFIVIKQSSEYRLTLNRSDLRRQTDGDRVVLGVEGPVVQPLMRPQPIVVADVGLDTMIEVFEPKTPEVIQALTFERSNPGFGVAVGDGGSEGRPDGLCFHRLDQPVERCGVFGVPVAEQELHLQVFVFEPHTCVAGLLEDPLFVGVVGAGRDKHLPTAKVDKHQPISDVFACRCPDGLAEEVCGDDHVPVRFDEGPPRGCDPMRGVAFGIGQDPFLFKDPPDRSTADGQCQLFEFADDPSSTPTCVLFSKSKDQCSKRSGDLPGAADPANRLVAVSFSQPAFVSFYSDDTQEIGDAMVQLGPDLHQPVAFFGRKDDTVTRDMGVEQLDLEFEEADLRVVSGRIGVDQQGQERMKPSRRHNEHFFKNGLNRLERGARHFGPRPSGGKAGRFRYEGRNVLHETASMRS